MRHQTVVLVGLALGLVGRAAAQLPIIGGSYGQTVRFVITAGDPIPTEAGRCSAQVRILTRDLLPAAEKRFDLGPGESGFVDVNLNPLADRFRRRVELLPAVRVLGGRCAAAVEVYENVTGRTMAHTPVLLLPASTAIPSIGPETIAALTPVGLSLAQFVRLGAARGFDPQPDPPKCRAVLGFADERGNPVGPVKTIDLAVGGFDFVDLDPRTPAPCGGGSTSHPAICAAAAAAARCRGR